MWVIGNSALISIETRARDIATIEFDSFSVCMCVNSDTYMWRAVNPHRARGQEVEWRRGGGGETGWRQEGRSCTGRGGTESKALRDKWVVQEGEHANPTAATAEYAGFIFCLTMDATSHWSCVSINMIYPLLIHFLISLSGFLSFLTRVVCNEADFLMCFKHGDSCH